MSPAKYAKKLQAEGAHVLRINKRTVTIKHGDVSRRIAPPKEDKWSSFFNWLCTAIVIASTIFISVQLKKHTTRVEMLENQLKYEIYINQISKVKKNGN